MIRIASWAVLGVIVGTLSRAGEPKTLNGRNGHNGRRGPLAALPSKPGPHVSRISALADNQWLNLGSPAPDPKWGKARGRSWSAKATFAAELRGAFVAGQGVHAYVKPDGRYQDDIFFYDINRHRWVCVYPGADVKNISLTVNKDGFEVDKTGQPIPVAWCGHLYQDITYNSDAKKLMFMDNGDPYWKRPLARRLKWLKDKKLAHQGTPWFLNTLTGKFERRACTGTPPRHAYGRVLVYLGGGRTFYWYGAPWEFVWFHDYRTSKWTRVKPAGAFPPWGGYTTACYDTKRKRVYVGGRGGKPEDALYAYDAATNTWSNPKPGNATLVAYANNVGNMHYDSASDAVVVFARSSYVHGKSGQLGVHVYDPVANAWRKPLPLPLDVKRWTRACWSGFYDPKLNAHFLHAASDSRDNGTMWVYRYKRSVAKKN